MSIPANIAKIQKELPSTVQLMAVTKNRTLDEIKSCLKAGVSYLGENRVQEAEKKFLFLEKEGWTFKKILIGPLQSNKVKKAVALFDEIHSVDRLEIALKLSAEAQRINKVMPVLIEVNIGKDPNKHGFGKENLFEVLSQLGKEKGIRVNGLMTIVPFKENLEDTRAYFSALKVIFEGLKAQLIPGVELQELSMGMSHDYRVAVQEGATIVRLGTVLFED